VQKVGVLHLFPFAIEATLQNSLRVGAPFVAILGILLFFTVLASAKFDKPMWLGDYVFPTLSFIVVLVVWIAKDLKIHGMFGWAGFVHMGAIGGVCAFSLSIHLSTKKLLKSVESMMEHPHVRRRDTDVMMKRLELEHNSIQAALQWIVGAVIIFLTAGVGGYYYSGFADPSDPMIAVRLFNLFNGMIWALIGFLFGMFTPLAKAMEHFRKEMAELLET